MRGLATALLLLRGALIRTVIGTLIVGAGELVYQFTRLVSGAGSFGAAISLLKDLAVEVWERTRMGAAAAGAVATTMFFDLKADAASGMQSAIESVVAFGNTAANTFEGAYEAIKAIWDLLPAAIGDLAFQAANSVVDGVEAMRNGVGWRINGFMEGINTGLEALGVERRVSLIGDLELGRIGTPFAGSAAEAGAEARAAFQAAFNSDPIAMPDLGLDDYSTDARSQAEALREMMAGVVEAATAPLESVAALREAVSASGAEAQTALTGARTAAEALETAIDDAGDAAGRAGGAGRGAGQALREGAETAHNAWEATAKAVRAAQEPADTMTRNWAGTISSRSLRSSPILCIAPQPHGHLILSGSITCSMRGSPSGRL